MTTSIRTRVAIVGAGPAGLILSHLLADAGIESVVIDQRTREQIESTIRAGILEQGTVDLLTAIDPDTRVHTIGDRHAGIELRFQGEAAPCHGHELGTRTRILALGVVRPRNSPTAMRPPLSSTRGRGWLKE